LNALRCNGGFVIFHVLVANSESIAQPIQDIDPAALVSTRGRLVQLLIGKLGDFVYYQALFHFEF
jgi:hypothetical protein